VQHVLFCFKLRVRNDDTAGFRQVGQTQPFVQRVAQSQLHDFKAPPFGQLLVVFVVPMVVV
jgi:hypothetical protein